MFSEWQEELTESGRNIWLAGLGALATVEEEGSKLFNRFVERGKDFEERRQQDLEEVYQRATSETVQMGERAAEAAEEVTEAGTSAQRTLMGAVTETMDRLGVPTRSRVDTLSEQVEDLSRKVEELTRLLDEERRGRTTDTATEHVYHVEPHGEGWQVMKEGNDRATSLHEVKQEAVEAGRQVAHEHLPSKLVIHKQDGTVQEELHYEGDA